MRKISRMLAVMFICLSSFLLTTACGVKIENASVKSGTLETTVVKNSQVDTSNVVVIVTYSDDTTAEVTADQLEFSAVDTSVVTEHAVLTITFEDYSFDVYIRVRPSEADVNDISQFVSMSQDNFKTNTSLSNPKSFYNPEYKEGVDFAEFEDRYKSIEPRYVGTDNPFVLDLKVGGYDEYGKVVSNLANVRTNTVVELINGDGTYTLLDETTTPYKLSDYVTVSDIDAEFQFKTLAEGKAFRVTVEPANKVAGSQTIMSVQAELHVIDGFNVHNAKELSVYDNSGFDYDQDGTPDWNAIKNEVGVLNYSPTTIILQNDISITKDDVPSTMFWSNSNILFNHDSSSDDVLSSYYTDLLDNTNQTLAGSMVDRDGAGVYHHYMSDGEELQFIGNYFTVSCDNLPKSVVELDGSESYYGAVNTGDNASYMTMHMALFCHEYIDGLEVPTAKTDVTWKNLNFVGNGSMSSSAEYSGSIILGKSYSVSTTLYNCVSSYYAINYFMHTGDDYVVNTEDQDNANDVDLDGNFVIDYCKFYNAYQAIVWLNGVDHLLISNSELKGSNGPAIMSVMLDYEDYLDSDPSTEYHPSEIDIVATTVESIVSGKEPWFVNYGADEQVASIVGMDTFFNGSVFPTTGKSIIKDSIATDAGNVSRINVQVIMMNDASAMPSFDTSSVQILEGYTRFFDSMQDYKDYYAETLEETYIGLDWSTEIPTLMKNTTALYAQDDKGNYFAPVEESNYFAYLPNNLNFEAMMGGDTTARANYMTAFDESSYMHLYLPNGMGAVLEFYGEG